MENMPLLRLGSYGTHIIETPTKKFIFVGTIPQDLAKKCYDTKPDSVNGFIHWFHSLPDEEQRELIGDIRTDIFAKIIETKQ